MRGWVGTLVGLLTLAVLATGGWYLFDLVNAGSTDGEEIRFLLKFSDAHGVPVAGAVRHKGVSVGEVLSVDISADDSSVIMEVAVDSKFHFTLRHNSRFWIVRPRFGGLTEGAFGLDTLIKDPYVEYDTPSLSGPRLSPGYLVYGLSLPPVPEEDEYYVSKGRRPIPLSFRVRFSQAQGLREGTIVRYRDVPVGKVLGVDLSRDGRSVEVEVMIHDRYRETARTDSVFWVAKPNVEVGFNWPNFLNVQELSKILTGSALAYATPTKSTGAPLRNNDIVDGFDNPPEDLGSFQGPLVSISSEPDVEWISDSAEGWELVGISFSFTDKDTLSPDDNYFFQGSGLLFKGGDGSHLILTARTLADGEYSSSDMLGDPDIADIDRKIRLLDKSIMTAEPLWMDPLDRDAAVLRLKGAAPSNIREAPGFSAGKIESDYLTLLAFRENDTPSIRSQPIPRDKLLDEGAPVRPFHPDLNLELRQWYGAVLVDGQHRVVGIVGRREAFSEEAALITFNELPALEGEGGQ